MGKLLETCRAYLLLVANRELARPAPKGGASDLVQETFLDGQRNFGRFKGETEAELLAWLRGILLNNLAIFDRRYRQTAKRQIARETSLESSRGRAAELSVAAPASAELARRRPGRSRGVRRPSLAWPADYRRIIVLVHLETFRLPTPPGR